MNSLKQLVLATGTLAFLLGGCSSSKNKGSEEKVQQESSLEAKKVTKVTAEKVVKDDQPIDPYEARIQKYIKQNEELINQLPDSLMFSMQRTACYGRCPTYTVSVYKSGWAIYEGKNWVDKMGTYTAKLGAMDLSYLDIATTEVNFFELKDLYDTQVTDFPSTICYANYVGKRKRITDRSSAPEAFKNYTKKVDAIFDKQNWKSVEGQGNER